MLKPGRNRLWSVLILVIGGGGCFLLGVNLGGDLRFGGGNGSCPVLFLSNCGGKLNGDLVAVAAGFAPGDERGLCEPEKAWLGSVVTLLPVAVGGNAVLLLRLLTLDGELVSLEVGLEPGACGFATAEPEAFFLGFAGLPTS